MRKLRNKKGGLQSLIRVHRIGFRLLKKIHSVDSVIIPRHLLKICLSLGQVYAGLFLTAELIDALLSGSFRGALEFAAALLVSNLLFGVAIHLVQRRIPGWRKSFSFPREPRICTAVWGCFCTITARSSRR